MKVCLSQQSRQELWNGSRLRRRGETREVAPSTWSAQALLLTVPRKSRKEADAMIGLDTGFFIEILRDNETAVNHSASGTKP